MRDFGGFLKKRGKQEIDAEKVRELTGRIEIA
jgi:hypothetical protein